MQNNVCFYKTNLGKIFEQLRSKFSSSQKIKSPQEIELRGAIEHPQHLPREHILWFQNHKTKIFKSKTINFYHEITGGLEGEAAQNLILKHAQNKILDRLCELLPHGWDIRARNLIGDNEDCGVARLCLSEQLSKAIEGMQKGEERDRNIEAFELSIALRALHTQGDQWYGSFQNALGGDANDLSVKQYRELLCDAYLFNTFAPLDDLLLPRNGLPEKEYRDRVFQSFIRVIFDIVRSYNKTPFEPQCWPSCAQGSAGRMVAYGFENIKNISFRQGHVSFNGGAGFLDEAVTTIVLQSLGKEENKELLALIQKMLMGDEVSDFALKPFFDLKKEQKQLIVDQVTEDLLCDWLADMGQLQRQQLIKKHTGRIKAAVTYHLEQTLKKYSKQSIDYKEVPAGFFVRLTESSLKQLLDTTSSDSVEEITTLFTEYKHFPIIMELYYKEKGLEAALTLLRNLKNLPEVTPEVWFGFLKDIILVGGPKSAVYLNEEEKNAVSKALLNPLEDHEFSGRSLLLAKFNWKQLSEDIFPSFFGPEWKVLLLQPDHQELLKIFLEETLKARGYSAFLQATKDLYTNVENQEQKNQYRVLAESLLQATLEKEVDNSKDSLLSYLFTTSPSNDLVEWGRGVLIASLARLENVQDPLEQKRYRKFLSMSVISGVVSCRPNNGGNVLDQTDEDTLLRWLLEPLETEEEEEEKNDRNDFLKNMASKETSYEDLLSLLGLLASKKPKIIEAFFQSVSFEIFAKNVLKAKRYDQFEGLVEGLEPSLRLHPEFYGKLAKVINEALLEEFNNSSDKLPLLEILLKPNQFLYNQTYSVVSVVKEELNKIIKELEPAAVIKILKNLDSFSSCSEELKTEISRSSQEQMNRLFNYFAITPGIGSECVDFLVYLRDLPQRNYNQQDLDTCLDSMYKRALDNRDFSTLKALWKKEKYWEMKDVFSGLFNTFLEFSTHVALGEVQKTQKAQAKALIIEWVSVLETTDLTKHFPSDDFTNWVKHFYQDAYQQRNWEACQLLLPIFNRYPKKFPPSFSRSEHLTIRLKIEGLTYEGNNQTAIELSESTKKTLRQFIKALNRSAYSKDSFEITSFVIDEFELFFKRFPEDPMLAEREYDRIIEEARLKISYDLKESRSKEQLNMLMTQLSSLRDQFVNKQEPVEPYFPYSWSPRNARHLIQKASTALKNFQEELAPDQNLLKGYLDELLNQTNTLSCLRLCDKEAEILYKTLSLVYCALKNPGDYGEAYESLSKKMDKYQTSFPWMKLFRYLIAGIFTLVFITGAILILAALLNPLGMVAGISSAAILSSIASVLTSSFLSAAASALTTLVTVGTGAVISALGTTTLCAGFALTASAALGFGIGSNRISFFAKNDFPKARAMDKVIEINGEKLLQILQPGFGD